MSVLFPFTLFQTRNVLSFYICSFIHNMFFTPILLLAAIQIFLLMDGLEKLLVLFRLGWSEVTAIFELRCLVFIKFGKYMVNIFTSICFFFLFSDSFRGYNYSSVISTTYILLGFSFCLFFSFIVSFWGFHCNDFKSLPSVVLSLPLIPFTIFFMVDFVIFISTGSFYVEFIAFMSLLNMFNISSHFLDISDTILITVSVSCSTNSMICVISESVSLDLFFFSLLILFSCFFFFFWHSLTVDLFSPEYFCSYIL